uniref:Putative myosin heavy chain n=1 Tax=Toxoplasma gondii TgCATBr9 TaxID=943120 RepID=A0A2T6IS29_TOXGO|nr:putative myosin heavy chain [Toxoplasma gondii TgCATBr9]
MFALALFLLQRPGQVCALLFELLLFPLELEDFLFEFAVLLLGRLAPREQRRSLLLSRSLSRDQLSPQVGYLLRQSCEAALTLVQTGLQLLVQKEQEKQKRDSRAKKRGAREKTEGDARRKANEEEATSRRKGGKREGGTGDAGEKQGQEKEKKKEAKKQKETHAAKPSRTPESIHSLLGGPSYNNGRPHRLRHGDSGARRRQARLGVASRNKQPPNNLSMLRLLATTYFVCHVRII